MIDIKFLRENTDIVKQNIKNKFQDHKLGLVDEVIELDASSRTVQQEADDLRGAIAIAVEQDGAGKRPVHLVGELLRLLG